MSRLMDCVPLEYNVFKLPLPVEVWHVDDKDCPAFEAHRLLSQFQLNKPVVLCHPSLVDGDDIGAGLFADHKNLSLYIMNVRIASLCSVDFIKGFLLPYKLLVCSVDECLRNGYRFSLSVDDGFHLQMPSDRYNVLGFANGDALHRHKDGYVTVRMDMLSSSYLKEGSNLYRRSLSALNRLAPCNVIVTCELDVDIDSLSSLLMSCGSPDCLVEILTDKVSVSKVVGDSDSVLLCEDGIVSAVDGMLDGVDAGVKPACSVSASAIPSPVDKCELSDDCAKRRKVSSSEDGDECLEDNFEGILQHKDALFKAYRSLSRGKGKNFDTLQSVFRELDASGAFFPSNFSFFQRVRHSIDDMIFRSMVPSKGSVSPLKPHRKNSEFVVSVTNGSYLSANTLFSIFRSSCSRLSAGVPFFIICATSVRSARRNMHVKELGTAATVHHLYIICGSTSPFSDASVIILTSH